MVLQNFWHSFFFANNFKLLVAIFPLAAWCFSPGKSAVLNLLVVICQYLSRIMIYSNLNFLCNISCCSVECRAACSKSVTIFFSATWRYTECGGHSWLILWFKCSGQIMLGSCRQSMLLLRWSLRCFIVWSLTHYSCIDSREAFLADSADSDMLHRIPWRMTMAWS